MRRVKVIAAGRSFESPEQDLSKRIIGQSAVVKTLRKTITKVASSSVDVLILGETGTGKELVARAIHDHSERADKVFVAINCGALTETLLESELFGHEKGAFTGADSQKIGLMEAASGGTLFLDEIGEMPLSMQVKLLRALQERTIRRVGGTKEIAIDVRIVAATMQDLDQAVKAKRFREDLYYRINVMRIDVPPLRKRGKDVLLLADHFLRESAADFGGREYRFSPEAAKAIRLHTWPGNIRELGNTLRAAMAVCETCEIALSDLPASLHDPESQDYELDIDDPDVLRVHLKRHRGNVLAVATAFGVARNTIYARLRKHGIDPRQYK